MKITAQEEYGLRCLLRLARAAEEGHSLTIPEIAAAEGMSPPYVAKLLAVLANPDADVRKVAQLIGSDATFSARLLRCVNSYEFGLASPVTNIQQAVAIAGLDRTRKITLTQAAAAYTQGALRAGEVRRCWQHSVATAVLADEHTLEIEMSKTQSLNDIFAQLSAQGIAVNSMRNKVNRLEELFVRLVDGSAKSTAAMQS